MFLNLCNDLTFVVANKNYNDITIVSTKYNEVIIDWKVSQISNRKSLLRVLEYK